LTRDKMAPPLSKALVPAELNRGGNGTRQGCPKLLSGRAGKGYGQSVAWSWEGVSKGFTRGFQTDPWDGWLSWAVLACSAQGKTHDPGVPVLESGKGPYLEGSQELR